MKILYLSCHGVLEFDELSILTELQAPFDVEVFSMGAFMNPTQSGDYMRSIIPKGRFYPQLYSTGLQCDKDLLHPELVEWADVIISMHNSRVPGQKAEQPWIANNWKLFTDKHKKVVWRSIGQSTPAIEKELAQYRAQGLKIIRYSPLENDLPDFCGSDALIRFAKDPDEFKGWTGERLQVISIAQSFKKRGEHLGFSVFDRVTGGFSRRVYGTENADLGELWGGQRTYEELKQNIRESRCLFYFGTVPAPYTLTLIEAMMTGIPVVAVGNNLRASNAYNWKQYEIPDIIQNGVNGYVSDNYDDLRGYIQLLLQDYDTAKRIGDAGRRTAIELFGKQERQKQWLEFLKSI